MLQAERKVQILETLVKVSAEITSTLDLDRVLDAIVTGPGAVIPYERAAIALEERGRLEDSSRYRHAADQPAGSECGSAAGHSGMGVLVE